MRESNVSVRISELGLSHRKVARMAGTSHATVGRVGRGQASARTAAAVANALGLTIGQALGHEPYEPPAATQANQ